MLLRQGHRETLLTAVAKLADWELGVVRGPLPWGQPAENADTAVTVGWEGTSARPLMSCDKRLSPKQYSCEPSPWVAENLEPELSRNNL